MQQARALRYLCLDVVVWYCAPFAFLLTYVNWYFAPVDAVLPHLRVLTLVLSGLALIRVLLFRLIPSRTGARLVASIVTATLLITILIYYGLVVIGLAFWGRVISWDLITSYAGQATGLAGALGISLPLSLGALVLAYVALVAVTWMYITRFDWTPLLVPALSGWLLALVVFSGFAGLGIELYKFLWHPWTRESEPVSLTFFPLGAGENLEGHSLDRLHAAALDRVEDAARSSYRPGSILGANAQLKNLILIVVDALRPDHMGIYGYARDTTPNLSRLANTGMLRKSATVHASCADSACGLSSLVTSKFLHQLSNRPFTLQEALKRNGYRIHMILGGDHTNFYNLKRLYGEVDSYFDGSMAREGYTNDDTLVVDRLASFPMWDGAPVMMQFHLMSAHILGSRHESAIKFLPSASYILLPGRGHTANTKRHSEQRFTNFYDNGVVQADSIIHDILETLGRKGYLHNTLVAITADHGEGLGEHDLFAHTGSVYEEMLRIPLVLLSYGYRSDRPIDRHVVASQVDIAPTLLAEMSIPRPATWSGFALQESTAREFSYFQEHWNVGLIDHRDAGNVWKYWINPRTGDEFAFNLSLDPGERFNAISTASLDRKRDWRLRGILAVTPSTQ